MNHIMIDLETMGNTPNAPIISIGAVFFEPSTGTLGYRFAASISLESSMSFGATPDASTIMWWMEQNEQARASFTGATETLPVVLRALSDFLAKHGNKKYLQVWGNGASFDCVILRNAYALCDLVPPWEWWNDRDVRTIVEIGKITGFNPKRDMPFVGVQHDALADAEHQAKYVSAIWQRLSGGKNDA